MEFDVVIAGSGVSGGSCALQLARQGLRVALFEREAFPRDKVCGEFLTPESVAHLQTISLEEQIVASGGLRITQAILHSVRGHALRFDFEKLHSGANHGLAISRRRLDQLLFENAAKAGAHCQDRARVDSVHIEGAGQRVEVTDLRTGETLPIRSRFFIDAAGRKSRFTDHPPGRRSYFGYKAHWPEPIVARGEVHLFFFRGGYGGATVVEGNRTSVCIMATPELFRNSRGDFSHLMAATVFQNQSACKMLAPLDPSFIRWISTGPLIFELKEDALTPWVHLGDAAGMIDPFTGEGMTFALRTASLLAREISRGGNYANVKDRFGRSVRAELERCYRNCARLRRIAEHPWVLDRTFQVAAHSRWLTAKLVEMTRPGRRKAEGSKLPAGG
ncbi:MAG TPA: NAD(P)/FAD-dependent oxidoreductase [Acidobacteriota bacterium]|jgi:flavin-dependent dehydrogenase